MIAVLVVLVTGTTLLAACRSRTSQATLAEQLVITRYRYVIDEKRSNGRVFAEVQNISKEPVREVEAKAYLRSRGGENRGENSAILRNIAPGEVRTFSILITSHGRAQDVAIEFQPVGQKEKIDLSTTNSAAPQPAASPK